MFYLLALSLHLAKFADESELMARLDLDKDGLISRPESVFNLILATHFKRIDLDNDDKISLSELEQSAIIKPKPAKDAQQGLVKPESH